MQNHDISNDTVTYRRGCSDRHAVASYGNGGGDGGSFTKAGTGRLVLASRSLYTGGTTIQSGELLVNNTSDSGTGRGAVSVEGSTLGGTGTIAVRNTVPDFASAPNQ